MPRFPDREPTDQSHHRDHPGPTRPPTGSTLAVILAAGAGSRFAGPSHKLNTTIGDRTVAQASIEHAIEAAIGEVVVVTGATQLRRLDATPGIITILHNPRWSDGQATSLATAVEYARRGSAAAIVVGLADQPFVTPQAWRDVAAATAPIAYATYDGTRGNPVRLAREIWDRLPRSGDEGARSLIRCYKGDLQEIRCSGSPADIDTLEDLEHGRTTQ